MKLFARLRALVMPAAVLSLCALAGVAVLPGCQTDGQTGAVTLGGVPLPTTQQVQDAHDQAVVTLNATTQYADQLQQQINALPASDPVRKQLGGVLADVQKQIVNLQHGIDLFDAAKRTATSGEVDPQLVTSAGSLFGIYGSLAAAAIAGGFGLYKHLQAGGLFKAATQLVQSVPAVAGPAGLTDAQKAALNQIQDDATRKLVDQIKATLPGSTSAVVLAPAAAPPVA